MSSEQRFPGWATLDVAAVHRGDERGLALWYLLRFRDSTGSGVVHFGGLGPSDRRAALRGDGVFWRGRHRGDFFLRGLPEVCMSLGVTRLAGAYLGPLSWLEQRRRGILRARLALNALSVLRNGRPISVRTAADLCDVRERTLQYWLSRSGWRRLLNVAPLAEGLRDYGEPAFIRKYGGDSVRLMRLRGDLGLYERLPNTLGIATEPRKRRAARRRVNQVLEAATCDYGQHGQRRRYLIPRPGRPVPTEGYAFSHLTTTPHPNNVRVWRQGAVIVP